MPQTIQARKCHNLAICANGVPNGVIISLHVLHFLVPRLLLLLLLLLLILFLIVIL